MVTAIINIKVTPKAKYGYKSVARIVSEFKEVESVNLMSGDYDLSVVLQCADLKEIGRFVGERLSTIEGVEGTATSFVLEQYKSGGKILDVDEDERGLFTT
jgi:DNA-binding Lrp family transcriptional regulator